MFMNLTDAGNTPMVHFVQREKCQPSLPREQIKQQAMKRRKYFKKSLENDETMERLRNGINPHVTKQEIP